MRGRQRRYKRDPLKVISELNMTPVIDITFLLLIAFLITYPLMENSVGIKLPTATTNKVEPDKNEPHNLAIHANGDILFNNTAMSLEELGVELAQRVYEDPQTAVKIRGDEALDYGNLMKVVAVLNKARVTRMALISTVEGRK
jgi:biopolymer transport protein ExbD